MGWTPSIQGPLLTWYLQFCCKSFNIRTIYGECTDCHTRRKEAEERERRRLIQIDSRVREAERRRLNPGPSHRYAYNGSHEGHGKESKGRREARLQQQRQDIRRRQQGDERRREEESRHYRWDQYGNYPQGPGGSYDPRYLGQSNARG